MGKKITFHRISGTKLYWNIFVKINWIILRIRLEIQGVLVEIIETYRVKIKGGKRKAVKRKRVKRKGAKIKRWIGNDFRKENKFLIFILFIY